MWASRRNVSSPRCNKRTLTTRRENRGESSITRGWTSLQEWPGWTLSGMRTSEGQLESLWCFADTVREARLKRFLTSRQIYWQEEAEVGAGSPIEWKTTGHLADYVSGSAQERPQVWGLDLCGLGFLAHQQRWHRTPSPVFCSWLIFLSITSLLSLLLLCVHLSELGEPPWARTWRWNEAARLNSASSLRNVSESLKGAGEGNDKRIKTQTMMTETHSRPFSPPGAVFLLFCSLRPFVWRTL